MNLRKLLKINLINAAILAMIIVFRVVCGMLFNGHDEGADIGNFPTLMTAFLLLLWAGYTVYSNMIVLKENEIEEKEKVKNVKSRLQKAGKPGFFQEERTRLLNVWDGIMSREKYFTSEERDYKIQELYQLTQNQLMRNITNAAEYMESFDYVTGKDSGYLREVCNDSQQLLDKFNKLAELSVTFDDTSLDYDTREMDDMIEYLELMRKTGKAKLGS